MKELKKIILLKKETTETHSYTQQNIKKSLSCLRNEEAHAVMIFWVVYVMVKKSFIPSCYDTYTKITVFYKLP